MSSTAVGIIIQPTYLMMVLTPSRSSDFTRVKRRASALSLKAYDSVPTAVACMLPLPAATKLPDSTASPAALSRGSASPVSSDSSTSRPTAATTSPSTLIWSPGRSTTTSSSTSSRTATSCSAPSRTTQAVGALSTARRSRACLERTSCTMPIRVLSTRTIPNRASRYSPTATMTTSRIPSSRLNGVKMLARTIWSMVRLVGLGTSLLRPSARRSATSVVLSPCVVSVAVMSRTPRPPAPPPPGPASGAGRPRSRCP